MVEPTSGTTATVLAGMLVVVFYSDSVEQLPADILYQKKIFIKV